MVTKYEKKSKKPIKLVVKPALPGTVLPSKPSNQLTKAPSTDTGTLDKNKVVRIFLGDDAEMHTFWTLSLTATTTVKSLCDLLAEKLTLPPGSFRLYVSVSDTELVIGDEELILPYKIKRDAEGKPYTLLVRSTKQEDLGVNFSRTGTLKRSVFVEPVAPVTPAPAPQNPPATELQIFPISINASQILIPSSIADQLKQIYISLQKTGSLPAANNDWEMLVNLFNSTVPVCLEIALKLFINLTAEESNQTVICNDEGIIKRAISIFEVSEVKLKEVVAWFLANLSVNPNNMERLCNLNLIPMFLPVIQLTNGNCPYTLKVFALLTNIDIFKALLSLSRVAKSREILLNSDSMKQIVFLLDNQDPAIINYGLQIIVNFPLTESLPKKIILEANGLSSVIKVANQEATSPKNPVNKKLSVWILLNLDLDGTLNDTIREYGGIPPLVSFLGADTEEFVRGQAASLLTNMVVNNDANMEALRNCGAIPALLALSQDTVSEDVQQRAIWCISNMLVSEDNHHAVIEAGGLGVIISKLSSSNQGILTLCADALANITQFDDFIRMEIGSLGAIPLLLNLISITKTKPMNTDAELKEHVMRALVNLAHNSDNEEKMLASGAIPLLVNYLALGVSENFQRYAIMILVNLSLNEKVRIAIRIAGGLSLAAILLCNLNVFEEDSVIQHTMKLLTNLAINGKNRKVMRDTLCLVEFLHKNQERFKPLEKEYEMIFNNLSFITSSENEEQDDLDEKLFMEFMSKPTQPEPIAEEQMIVQEEEPHPSTTVKSSSNHPRRQKIVDEILSTERSYVESLTTLVKKYMNPLESNAKSKKPIVPPDKIRHLFSIADVLMNFHSIFLGELSKRVLRWSETQLLGDCFIEMCTGLKMYTDYVNNYNRSIATLQECNKKEAFVDFISKIQMANNMQNLESYLIMPVQRVPRYNMLLQDLSKNTGQDHPDYKNINIALEQMKEVALLINEAERSWSKVKAIQDIIQGNFKAFAGGNRSFMKEGDLILASEPLHVFLMNDLFILTKPLHNPKGNYKYRFSERLDINDVEAKDGGPNAFRLVVFGEKYLTFTAPSAKEKDDWLASIKKCEAKSRRRSIAFTKNS